MSTKKLSIKARYVLLVGVLLLVANTVLGVVILGQSTATMHTLINKNMLDLADSAAASLNPYDLESLSEEDVGGSTYRKIEHQLLAFMNNADIMYIYTVRQQGENDYIFTVDPDPKDPADFGEKITITPALISAGKGIHSVDTTPVSDRWGTYNTAYCPVFNTSREVVGIVGVDFDYHWYEEQLRQHAVSTIIVTAISVLFSALIIAFATHRIREKIQKLDHDISELSDNIDVLTKEVADYSDGDIAQEIRETNASSDVGDELEVLNDKIKNMQHEMGIALNYLHAQAYTDALTKVGNTTAYHDAVDDLNLKIAAGEAEFWVVFFDINGLKELNDNYGHECGDQYIRGAAQALAHGFGEGGKVYRVGGDEFTVVAENMNEKRLGECLALVNYAVATFNAESSYPVDLAVSHGVARFVPGEDETFEAVFARADQAMYEEKRAFYQKEQ